MTVNVLVFAGLRELLGSEMVNVEVREAMTYAGLVSELSTRFPSAAPLLGMSRIAAGGAFVTSESTVEPNAEIAIIPPVSGG